MFCVSERGKKKIGSYFRFLNRQISVSISVSVLVLKILGHALDFGLLFRQNKDFEDVTLMLQLPVKK